MKASVLLSVLLCALCTQGCDPYVPDPLDPRLPKITMDGNNAAGAIIDGRAWSVAYHGEWFSRARDMNITKDGDDLGFSIWGTFQDGKTLEVSFHLKNAQISSMEGLRLLDDKKIILDGQENYGQLNDSCENARDVGQVYFTKVKIDPTFMISGTFGFTFNAGSCNYKEVYYGRFDFSRVEFHF